MGTTINRRRHIKSNPTIITAVFNVVDDSVNTNILHWNNITSYFSKITIDGVKQDTVEYNYPLSAGTHVIQYLLKYANKSIIPEYCFLNVKTMVDITIPEDTKVIRANAFEGCSSLTSINIPPNVKEIQTAVFTSCSSLTTIFIPDTVTKFTPKFNNCTNLEYVRFPQNDLTSFGNHTFFQCTHLKRVNSDVDGVANIYNSITSFGISTFNGCKLLEDIRISPNLTSVTSHTFAGCSNLKRVNSNIDGVFNVPLSLKTIPQEMFVGCANLVELNIATDLISFGGSACGDCTQLSRINSNVNGVFNLPNTVTSIGNMCFRRNKVVTCNIPPNLNNLGYSAFANSTLSGNIIIPQTISKLNQSTFAYSNITGVDIPETVTEIVKELFLNCSSLLSAIIRSIVPPTLGNKCFLNTSSNLIIYVPSTSVNDYKTAANWSEYANKILAIPAT